MIFGEELTVFWFVRGEYEKKNLQTTGLNYFILLTTIIRDVVMNTNVNNLYETRIKHIVHFWKDCHLKPF